MLYMYTYVYVKHNEAKCAQCNYICIQHVDGMYTMPILITLPKFTTCLKVSQCTLNGLDGIGHTFVDSYLLCVFHSAKIINKTFKLVQFAASYNINSLGPTAFPNNR